MMISKSKHGLFFFGLYTLLIGFLSGCDTTKVEESDQSDSLQDYPLKAVVGYRLRLQNYTGRELKADQFRLYTPIIQSPFQSSSDLHVSLAHRNLRDSLGNEAVLIDFKTVGISQVIQVKVNKQVGLVATPLSLPEPDLDRYLEAERFVEKNAPDIQKVVKTLMADNETLFVSHIHDWLLEYQKTSDSSDTVESKADDSPGAELADQHFGALAALHGKDDSPLSQALLFIALSRASNIPARCVIGVLSEQSGTYSDKDVNVMVEVFVNNQWQLVDVVGQQKTESPSHFIRLRVLRDVVQPPQSAASALLYESSGVGLVPGSMEIQIDFNRQGTR